MNDNPYNFDSSLADEEYTQNENQSNLVQLPFDAPFISWRHGNPDSLDEQQKPTSKYFGRWGIDCADWDKLCEKLDIPVPEIKETHAKKDKNYVPIPNEFYHIYTWRFLIFAPIGGRVRWIDGKSQSQTLVYIANKTKNGLEPLTPAILTTKSWTASKFNTAREKWLDFCSKFDTGIPAHFFYCAIGTFGDVSKFAGSHGKETYPQLFIRDGLDATNLPYIGNELARTISQLNVEALDWYNDEDWLHPENADQSKSNRGYSRQQQSPQNDPIQDDEIPF